MLTDPKISFARFHKVDKFYWSPNKVSLLGLLLMALLIAVLKEPLPEWYPYVACSWPLYYFYHLIKSNFTYEILKGHIDGELAFSMESIEFDGQQHSIDTIESVLFSFGQKEGAPLPLYSSDINGKVSRGVDNSATIKFKDGRSVKLHFQVPWIFDHESFKPIFIAYTRSGLISFMGLISLLGLKYKEVQELKAEHFRDML